MQLSHENWTFGEDARVQYTLGPDSAMFARKVNCDKIFIVVGVVGAFAKFASK